MAVEQQVLTQEMIDRWEALAAQAGLAKMRDGCQLPSKWHVTRVELGHPLYVPELGWYVYAQLVGSTQTMWTFVTVRDILSWQLEQAKARELKQLQDNLRAFFQALGNYAKEQQNDERARSNQGCSR